MLSRHFCAVVFATAALSISAQSLTASSDLASTVKQQVPDLIETYKHLHRSPELSRHEELTSSFLAT